MAKANTVKSKVHSNKYNVKLWNGTSQFIRDILKQYTFSHRICVKHSDPRSVSLYLGDEAVINLHRGESVVIVNFTTHGVLSQAKFRLYVKVLLDIAEFCERSSKEHLYGSK